MIFVKYLADDYQHLFKKLVGLAKRCMTKLIIISCPAGETLIHQNHLREFSELSHHKCLVIMIKEEDKNWILQNVSFICEFYFDIDLKRNQARKTV